MRPPTYSTKLPTLRELILLGKLQSSGNQDWDACLQLILSRTDFNEEEALALDSVELPEVLSSVMSSLVAGANLGWIGRSIGQTP